MRSLKCIHKDPEMESRSERRLAFILAFVVCLSSRGACRADCVGVTMPAGCTCANDTGGRLPTRVACVGAGLTSLPAELAPADVVRIENNTIDVVADVRYGAAVRYLYLRRNGIRLIRDGAFAGLAGLVELALGFNEITSLRRATFAGLAALRTLTLVGNPLYVLRANTFDGGVLPRLENLDLDDCRLLEFEPGAVDGLSSLLFLTLSHNRLGRFPRLGCSSGPLDGLTTLDVAHNEIAAVPRPRCPLPGLRHLNADDNRLAAWDAGLCEATAAPGLEFLRLRDNGLTSIDADALAACRNLTTLDISRNRLTAVDERAIPWQAVGSVMLGDNPWHCGCDNLWLTTQPAVKESNTPQRVRCATPDIVNNLSVFSVYDAAFAQCVQSSSVHVLPVVTGVVCLVMAVSIGSIVIYFVLRKRSLHHPIVGLPLSRSGSSIYRRMSSANEAIFDYTSTVVQNDPSHNRPVWREMSTRGPSVDAPAS